MAPVQGVGVGPRPLHLPGLRFEGEGHRVRLADVALGEVELPLELESVEVLEDQLLPTGRVAVGEDDLGGHWATPFFPLVWS